MNKFFENYAAYINLLDFIAGEFLIKLQFSIRADLPHFDFFKVFFHLKEFVFEKLGCVLTACININDS